MQIYSFQCKIPLRLSAQQAIV